MRPILTEGIIIRLYLREGQGSPKVTRRKIGSCNICMNADLYVVHLTTEAPTAILLYSSCAEMFEDRRTEAIILEIIAVWVKQKKKNSLQGHIFCCPNLNTLEYSLTDI